MINEDKLTENDSLNREIFVKSVINLINKINTGVIAIDGEWGVGKSWVGKNIENILTIDSKHKTVWIDTFEEDWENDPTLSIISGIASQLEKSNKELFIEKCLPLLTKLIPEAIKWALNLTGTSLDIDSKVISIVADAASQSSQSALTKKIESINDRKKTIGYLKELISTNITSLNKKVVIFVDELDRCSPKYAVQYLERLKHIFNIPNVIFVLLWNRQQITNTVKAFYGGETDGQMFLDKFIDFPMRLNVCGPKLASEPMRHLVNNHLNSFELSFANEIQNNINEIVFIASVLNLNARQTIRLLNLFALYTNKISPFFEIWLLGIKFKYPELFSKLIQKDNQVHSDLIEVINKYSQLHGKTKSVYETDLIIFHTDFQNNNFLNLEKLCQKYNLSTQALPSTIDSIIRRIETSF